MTAAVLAVPARRGRHRSGAADQAILGATLDVLAADGYGGLTMASVINKAMVSSATLYRRWPTKQALVAAALASLDIGVTDPDTGSLDGDIAVMIDGLVEMLSVHREDLSEHVAMAVRRYPEFRAALNDKFLTPRLAVMEHILTRARRRGELGPGLPVDVAYSLVSGPLHHRMYMLDKPATPAFRRTLTKATVAALRAIAPA